MPNYSRLNRSVTELRERFGDDLYTALRPPLQRPAPNGEIALTPGQRQALIRLRGSDTAKAVIEDLRKRNEFVATTRDLIALHHLGWVINKGAVDIIDPKFRWKADQIVNQYARELKLHILTYSYSRNGFVRCCCGFTRHVSAYGTDQVMALGRAGARHLGEVSVMRMDPHKTA